jgi:pyruvate dehydrogenase (quinone)
MGANRVRGNPQYGVQLQPIDFVALAPAARPGYTVAIRNSPAGPKRAFAYPGPAVVEAVVDPNEPPLPGKIMTKQSWHFAKALAKVQKDCWEIIKMVVEDKICEVV